ncbi:MAG TPA: hypothetical protein VH988_36305 [Thermoanaerobaculia bacterium]|nr:hypothetical protein [Thermoanaerobaculia bacterium]
MSRPDPPREYPNVKVRLRLVRRIPALPVRDGFQQIWLKGTRFRLRDDSGREILSLEEGAVADEDLAPPIDPNLK